MKDDSCPIACDLSALASDEQERRRMLASKFARSVIGRSEVGDGFEFRLDERQIGFSELAEWIALERRCCPFLRFRIEAAPSNGGITVGLGGASGVKDFLRRELTG